MLKTNEKKNSSKLIRGEKKKGWAEKQNVEKD